MLNKYKHICAFVFMAIMQYEAHAYLILVQNSTNRELQIQPSRNIPEVIILKPGQSNTVRVPDPLIVMRDASGNYWDFPIKYNMTVLYINKYKKITRIEENALCENIPNPSKTRPLSTMAAEMLVGKNLDCKKYRISDVKILLDIAKQATGYELVINDENTTKKQFDLSRKILIDNRAMDAFKSGAIIPIFKITFNQIEKDNIGFTLTAIKI